MTPKQHLKEQYAAACNDYLLALLTLWEIDGCYGYWSGDEPGTIYHYGDTHDLTMEEIIYIVDNDIPEQEVLAWEDYTLDASEFHLDTPSLRAWHSGCPRTPPETFQRLRDLTADLMQAVEEEKQRVEKSDKGSKSDPY